MKGWMFQGTNLPLKLVEKPDPVAEPDLVVIDVKACGLCHSDVGALEDEKWLALVHPGNYLGHEFAGVISAVGSDIKNFKVGDRVAVCPSRDSRGQTPSYNGRDGAYADKAIAMEERLIKIPDHVPFTFAAAATDAGMTSYQAIMFAGGCKPGMKVGLVGIGGLGQFGVREAVLAGAEVYVATRNPGAQQLALELGAKVAVSTPIELKPYQLDLIVDFAGGETTTAQAVNAVRDWGTVVLVGMATHAPMHAGDIITRKITLRGSAGGTPEAVKGVIDMIASGDLVPRLEEISFDQIPEGLERLRAGGLTKRLVAVM